MAVPIAPSLFDGACVVMGDGSLTERARRLAVTANAASVEAARVIAYLATVGWWDASVAAFGPEVGRLAVAAGPMVENDLPENDVADARRFGRDLAKLDIKQAHAELGRLYTRALPDFHRAANGVYYTPSALTERLLDRAERAGVHWQTARVIDPSCGGGAFLIHAAERMVAALRGTNPAILLSSLASRLRGWDIDPFATWLAQVAVEVLVLPSVISSGRRLGNVVEVRDALACFIDAKGQWDLVMGNPPFGKVKDRPVIRELFRRSLHGHPNTYGLFTDLAVHLARPSGGTIAYLTPASFLAGNYFKSLRRLLHDEAPPVSLDLIESRTDVFEDVLQEVALSVFQRGRTAQSAECAVIRVACDAMQVELSGTLTLPDDPEGPWLLPRSAGDVRMVERLRDMPARLADWGYSVSTGPLVWNRHKPQLHADPKLGAVPVVWAEAVTQDGRFELRSTRRNHHPWYSPRGGFDPNLVAKPCVLVQRTTAKEQARRLVAAEMPMALIRRHGSVTVENHLNMIRPAAGRPKVPLRLVAAFLRTETADRVLRCINASVAVSASELEAMPLPAPEQIVQALADADPEAAVRRLYHLGAG
jgi:adenine-specific DNA-methyltransferase